MKGRSAPYSRNPKRERKMIMKNTNKKPSAKRKLFSAIAMLTMSAVMLSTSTYAWFSMNKEVSVSSMSISAKSADPIIEISANGTDFYNSLVSTGDGANWTLPTTTADTKLKLVTPSGIATSGTVGAVTWGWAASTAHNNAQVGNTLTEKALSAQTSPAATNSGRTAYLGVTDDALYVLTQKLTIRNVSADVVANNLKIKEVNINKGTNSIGNAVRVLFVAADGKYALYEPAGSGTTASVVTDHQWLDSASGTAPATDMAQSSGKPIIISSLAAKGTTAGTFAAGSSTDVDVYVFFDGTDDDAYTDLATDLSNVTIDFTFAID
jgi:hypothetical protein